MTLSGANTFTGATNVNAGTLVVTSDASMGAGGALNINNAAVQMNGSFIANHAVNIGGTATINVTAGNTATISGAVSAGTLNLNGTGTLRVTGPVAATVNVNTGGFGGTSTVTGAVTVASGAGIDLSDHQLGTLTLSGGLTISSGTLKFDIGGLTNAADVVAVANSLTASSTTIAFSNAGINPGTYTIMTYGSGTSTAGLSLSSTTLGASTIALDTSSPTALKIVVSGAPIPATAVWTGTNGAAWGALSGTNTNFNKDVSSGVNTNQTPGAATDVVFVTSNPAATNLSTTLDQDYTVKSITLNSSAGAVSIAGPGLLTVLGGGLTAQAGSGGLTITANVAVGASQTWNNAAATPLAISGNVSGTGTLTMTGNIALNGTNSYVGGTNIDGGTVVMGNATALGAVNNTLAFGAGGGLLTLNGSPLQVSSLNGGANAIIENAGAGTSNSLITVTTTAANTYNGVIRAGATGSISLTQIGGSLTLGGNSTIPGNVIVRQGKMILTGSIATTPLFTVADTTGLTAQVVMSGGSITSNGVSIGSAGTTGVLVFNSGAITSSGEIWPGTTNNGYGALLMNGGTMTVANFLSVSRSGAGTAGVGILYMTGGDIEVTVNNAAMGAYNNGAATDGVFKSTATFTGGVLHTLNQVYFSENVPSATTLMGQGLINADGGATIALTDLPTTAALNFGIFNLSGGTLTTAFLRGGTNAGTSTFNAHGGVLRAAAATTGAATFLQSVTNAWVWADGPNGGGLVLDDQGQALTIPQVLKAPTGNGVATITLSTATLGGYIGPPLITISGGGGSGATAIGNIDTNGNLTSISVTNPGIGYTSNPTVTISSGLGGGGATTAPGTTVTLAVNQSGGVNKNGAGSVTLSGANTFTGPSSINAGTLIFSGNSTIGSMTGAGNLTVSTAGNTTTTGVTVAGIWTINGVHNIAAGAGPAGTSKVSAVPTIANTASGTTQTFTGTLNITDSRLLVQSTGGADKTTKEAALVAAIKSGSNGGLWTGKGITSSTAAAANTSLAVGIFDNAVLNLSTIGGQPADTNTIMVAVAHIGDANRSGVVDIQDQSLVTNNWQTPATNWAGGDLNNDGFVDIQDLTLVTNNWQATSSFSQSVSLLAGGSAGGGVSAVPEPASLAVLAIGGAALLARRRRQCKSSVNPVCRPI